MTPLLTIAVPQPSLLVNLQAHSAFFGAGLSLISVESELRVASVHRFKVKEDAMSTVSAAQRGSTGDKLACVMFDARMRHYHSRVSPMNVSCWPPFAKRFLYTQLKDKCQSFFVVVVGIVVMSHTSTVLLGSFHVNRLPVCYSIT